LKHRKVDKFYFLAIYLKVASTLKFIYKNSFCATLPAKIQYLTPQASKRRATVNQYRRKLLGRNRPLITKQEGYQFPLLEGREN